MRGVFLDLTDMTFGELRAARFVSGRGWLCECSCGGEKTVRGGALTSGNVISCGCRANLSLHSVTHGMTGQAEYIAWKAMKARCLNPNHKSYAGYGGRGISICKEWECSFENFFRDMGFRPSELHSVDRIDNDGNYEPSNCRWATKAEQTRNRRPYPKNRRRRTS